MAQFIFFSMISFTAAVVLGQPISATYLGDSHSTTDYGLFEKALGRAGGDIKKQIRVDDGMAVCGASINSFLDTSRQTRCGFKSFSNGSGSRWTRIGWSQPSSKWLNTGSQMVIVQLGGNHISNPSSAYPAAKKMIKRIVAAGKQCIWIGTPAPHNPNKPEQCQRVGQAREEVAEYIKKAVKELHQQGISCLFIDSFELLRSTNLFASDCRHYSGSGYETWASHVVDVIRGTKN